MVRRAVLVPVREAIRFPSDQTLNFDGVKSHLLNLQKLIQMMQLPALGPSAAPGNGEDLDPQYAPYHQVLSLEPPLPAPPAEM